MPKRGAIPALKDILEAIDRIQRYVGTMSQTEFLENTEKQDAVVRNLEIIGEAVRSVPTNIRKTHKQIDWSQIAGMRDKLIHHYFGVNWEILWDVVQRKLPTLKANVEQILLGEQRDQ
jgi:uncharacterized protein with HEPN domain